MKPRTNLSQTEVDQIINSCKTCTVAMVDLEGKPYVLPFNFGYKEGRLYIHSGPEGKKIDIWKKNPEVCISFSTDYELNIRHENVACSYSMKYRSVLFHGKVTPVTDLDEKDRILNIVMGKYTQRNNFSYNTPALKNVAVFEIEIQKQESRSYLY
ncbi:MAG TPA: pyridoxamine 5'-phosphate oxidase family protein [Perlabentimonas sp.]|nr:pyridoxamine 5'-phosphate oxidase family protein [Perlabentimonas sp.]